MVTVVAVATVVVTVVTVVTVILLVNVVVSGRVNVIDVVVPVVSVLCPLHWPHVTGHAFCIACAMLISARQNSREINWQLAASTHWTVVVEVDVVDNTQRGNGTPNI